MQRTVRLKLQPTPEQAQVLSGTLSQFSAGFNHVCTYGWEHTEKNRVRLHHATYYSVQATCPGLASDRIMQARNNRRSQSRFVCRACGFELHADLNAASNLAAKYRASRGIPSTGVPWSTGVSSPLRCRVPQHVSPAVRDKPLPSRSGR